jgi:acetyl esterase/lipase
MFTANLYFGLSILLLLCTLGVVFPRVYGTWLAPLAAVPSMALALFFPHFLLLGIWLTVAVAFLGGLQTSLGQLGLLLHVLCWGLLVFYQQKVHHSLPVLDGAPVADKDHPFCTGLTAEEMEALRAGQISWTPSFTLRIPAMRDVEVVPDVIFREVDGVRLRLDVYRPRSCSGPLPCAIYIHGGGWITGTRRQSRFMLYELAAAGWVVFAISYRLAPRFPLPAAIHDCKAAVAWVREHAAQYGGKSDEIVVLGGSAGGHLAAMVALSAGEPRLQPGFESADTRVRGAVLLYGVMDLESILSGSTLHSGAMLFMERVVFQARYRDDPALFRLAQPLSYLGPEAPPILLVHGQNDGLVPIAQSHILYERLRAAGARAVHLLEVPFGLHAFEVVPSPLHQRTVRVILRFMQSLRG